MVARIFIALLMLSAGNLADAQQRSRRPSLPPLDAEVKPRGQCFSNHARRLLEIVAADYQLNGRPAHAKSTPEDVAQHARFIASLTQSKNKQLQSAALWTCLLYVIHAGENVDLELARKVAQWSLQSGSIDLQQEFEQLLEDGRGGVLDQAFGKFGQVLGAIVFTHEFRQHRLQQIRLYASGAVSALVREQMVKYADAAAVGQTPRSPPIRGKVLHVAKDRTYLQISNQTGRPQRHVMIATRGIADPDYVRRAANGYRLQAKVLDAFGFFPQAAAAEMPEMADVWEAIQLLDVGTILYVPEMPASASIKVELCSNDRLKLTEDVRASIWSDQLVAKDVPAWNLKLVLNQVRPPSERIDKKAREAARKKTEAMQGDLAKLALNLAKDAIARGDDARTRAFLLQAIKISPDSPAGKEAQRLLKKY